MCQLSYFNTRDSQLNRELFIIASAMGASVHKHGWGVINPNGESFKSAIPANLCLNSGEYIGEIDGPLMGHIRLASANVPVLKKNNHPFDISDIFQLHNGTLTPNVDKDHVTEEEVESLDDKNVTVKKKVKRSDSLVFLEHLAVKYFEADGDFVKALNDAMKNFHGKFAFIYYLKNTGERFIVRGKTADLHILYLRESEEENSKVTGYVINTSKDVLETSVLILSNLLQSRGLPPLYYTQAKLLKEETIYVPDEFDVREVGSIKENGITYSRQWEDADYFSEYGRGGGIGAIIKNFADADVVKYASEMFAFCEEFSISLYQLQALWARAYNCSIIEAEKAHMKHFVTKILGTLRSSTTKTIRKRVRGLCGGSFPLDLYLNKGVGFPWMANSKAEQTRIIKLLEERNKKLVM